MLRNVIKQFSIPIKLTEICMFFQQICPLTFSFIPGSLFFNRDYSRYILYPSYSSNNRFAHLVQNVQKYG